MRACVCVCVCVRVNQPSLKRTQSSSTHYLPSQSRSREFTVAWWALGSSFSLLNSSREKRWLPYERGSNHGGSSPHSRAESSCNITAGSHSKTARLTHHVRKVGVNSHAHSSSTGGQSYSNKLSSTANIARSFADLMFAGNARPP